MKWSGKAFMTQTITFPGLGLTFEVNPVLAYLPEFLGGLPIFWYGVIIALGFLAGALCFFARTKEFAVDADRAADVLLVAIVCAIVGARAYYVLFSWENYKDDLLRVFNIREGGLALYGGVTAAFLAGAIMCKIRRVKVLPVLDLASICLLLGQAIGRWGNFVNTEAFGANTTMPWGMTSSSIAGYLTMNREALLKVQMVVKPDMPVHPTFLYESLWCLLGFVVLSLFARRRRFDGQILLMYLGWYGLGRAFIEGLRIDSLLLGSLRISQLVAILCVIISVIVLAQISSRIKREGDDTYLMVYRDTEEGRQVIAGTFYKKAQEEIKTEAAAEETGGEEEEETEDLLEEKESQEE